MSELLRIRRDTVTPPAVESVRPLWLSAPAPRAGRRPASVADLALRAAWQLVGGYVWLVLLVKGPEPARPGLRLARRR